MDLVREPKQGVIRPGLLVAERPKDEHASVSDLPGQEVEECERGRVAPVEVFQHHEERSSIARLAQDRGQAVEDAEPLLVRIERLLGDSGGRREQLGHESAQVLRRGCARDERGRVRVPSVAPQDLDPGPVRGRPFPRPARAPQCAHPVVRGVPGDLSGQTSLSDPGLAADKGKRPAAEPGVVRAGPESSRLRGTADEGVRSLAVLAGLHVIGPRVPDQNPHRRGNGKRGQTVPFDPGQSHLTGERRRGHANGIRESREVGGKCSAIRSPPRCFRRAIWSGRSSGTWTTWI